MRRFDLELMRYHDLESDADERRRVEERLASDEDARDLLASLRMGSAAVRSWGETARVEDITDQVMGRIERDAVARRNRVKRLRRVSWSLMGSGLAAAASLWLWLGAARVDNHERAPDPIAALPGVAPVAPEAQPLAEMSAGAAIEKVDFGGNSGSIFLIQGARDATPVVWLSDPEGDQAKMEPL